MKKIIVITMLLFMVLTAHAENSSYDANTGIVIIPLLDINGQPTFQNIQLRLRSDGLLELVDIEEYEQASSLNTEAFSINSFGISDIGEIYLTEIGEIVIITGKSRNGIGYYYNSNNEATIDFRQSSTSLPDPEEGERGTFFALDSGGDIAYADSLGQSVSSSPLHINSFGISDIGEIYQTESGITLIITGKSRNGIGYYYNSNNEATIDFYETTSNLPSPEEGVKGTYFAVDTGGDIAYADPL